LQREEESEANAPLVLWQMNNPTTQMLWPILKRESVD